MESLPISRKKALLLFFLTSALVLAVSQLSSYLVYVNLEEGHSVKIWPFLHFTHIRNLGGIFGVLQGHGWLFTTMSILVLGGLMIFVLRIHGLRWFEYLCYGFIVGGGMGNILDRLIYGSVIDFIDIRGISFWKYIFNTADVMIHIGIWPLVVYSILETRRQETSKVKLPAEG